MYTCNQCGKDTPNKKCNECEQNNQNQCQQCKTTQTTKQSDDGQPLLICHACGFKMVLK